MCGACKRPRNRHEEYGVKVCGRCMSNVMAIDNVYMLALKFEPSWERFSRPKVMALLLHSHAKATKRPTHEIEKLGKAIR